MNRNARLAVSLAALVAGMVMLAYASVPLYRMFCAATGYGGTPRRADAATAKVENRLITVRFNADTDKNLDWDFQPGQQSVRVKLGAQTLIYYNAHNRSNRAITGRAVYNITPASAGGYFVKIECFCFKNQTLQPHERAKMPVSFYVDPAIMDDPTLHDLSTITLSYTFFEATSESK